jgi:hypothetical protein
MTAPAWHTTYLDQLEALGDQATRIERQSNQLRRLASENEQLRADPLVKCRNFWGSTTKRVSEWDDLADQMDFMLASVGAPKIERPWHQVAIKQPPQPQPRPPTPWIYGVEL